VAVTFKVDAGERGKEELTEWFREEVGDSSALPL